MAIDLNEGYRNGEEQAWKMKLAVGNQNSVTAQENVDEQVWEVTLTDKQRNLVDDIDMAEVDWKANLTEEQKKLMAEIEDKLLRHWNIRVLYGREVGDDDFAVEFVSLKFGGRLRLLLESELYGNGGMVIRELRKIGYFDNPDLQLVMRYVKLLKELGIATEVPSLLDRAKGYITEDEAKELYDHLVTSIIRHLDFFPRLSAELYQDGDNYGVQLDTHKYRMRFRLVDDNVQVFGVSSDYILTAMGFSDVRGAKFRQIIRAWIAYGFLIDEGTDSNHKTAIVKIGGKQVRFYLFRITNFTERLHAINDMEGFDK